MVTLLAASALPLTWAAVLARRERIKSDRTRQAIQQRLFELYLARLVWR